MPEDELYKLLDKLDGVHFTGGGLDLYDFQKNQFHPYYLTARMIFNYATQRNMTYENLDLHTA